MAKVPKLTEGPSAVELDYSALAEAEVPKPMVIAEHEKTKTAEVTKHSIEAKEKTVEEPELRNSSEQPKTLSPSQESELSKVSKTPTITPKRRRMASVVDTIMESSKVQTPALAPDRKGEIPKQSSEAGMTLGTTEAGVSVPAEARSSVAAKEGIEARPSEAAGATLMLEKEGATEESESLAPRAPAKEVEFIVRHASGKKLSREQIAEAEHYARDLKYPRGSLIYNSADEDNFLYCLPDNKEISVYREMAHSIGYPKLEFGLSAMLKDQLADNLAYKSLKVRIFYKQNVFCIFLLLCANPSLFCRA
jgi:hypothetical protein